MTTSLLELLIAAKNSLISISGVIVNLLMVVKVSSGNWRELDGSLKTLRVESKNIRTLVIYMT